jgi:glycosyltransferase involved in cell wall biosynthesis
LNPLVTVVVPTYQGETFVRATIDSVLAQTWSPFELIVVDDGSSDGTVAILESYGDRLRLVRQENRGVSAARNRGAAEGRGEFLAFLDHDDLWEPQLLATLVPILAADPKLGLVYSDASVIDARGNVRGRRGTYLNYRHGQVFEELLHGNFIPVETTILRASLFRELGGCDEKLRYLEDYELCLRFARHGPIGFHPGTLARYRIHARNLSHDLEPMLLEWLAVLERLRAPQSKLEPHQLAVVREEDARLSCDMAWRVLRRHDLDAARRWMARANGGGPFVRRLQIAVLRTILTILPRAAGDAVLRRLPRRKLYGVGAADTGDDPPA